MKTSETATLEILVMLAGAYILGWLTYWAVHRYLHDTAETHKRMYGAPSKDDLTIIEGIGPRINELLTNAGIESFADLAGSTRNEIKEILDQAGPRYQLHEPKSWIEQAKLAADGRFDELEALQATLTAGR